MLGLGASDRTQKIRATMWEPAQRRRNTQDFRLLPGDRTPYTSMSIRVAFAIGSPSQHATKGNKATLMVDILITANTCGHSFINGLYLYQSIG